MFSATNFWFGSARKDFLVPQDGFGQICEGTIVSGGLSLENGVRVSKSIRQLFQI